jgi:hypothetical protein
MSFNIEDFKLYQTCSGNADDYFVKYQKLWAERKYTEAGQQFSYSMQARDKAIQLIGSELDD